MSATLSPIAAYRDGLRRVRRAPWVWLGAWAATVLFALPLALVLRDLLATHLGASLVAERAAAGVHAEWWHEFRAQAAGLGTTFTPAIIGFSAVLTNLSDVADNVRMETVIAGVVAAWLAVWSLLSGGILDRYARQRPLGAAGFFGACGTYVWRLLRLGAIAFAAYYVLFAHVHGWLFDRGLYALWTRDTPVERNAFLLRLVLYLVFVALLTGVNLVVDYARVRLVVEDRRSAVFALAAGARFVRRHLAATLGLYALNALGFLVLAALYAAVAPGAGRTGWTLWFTLLVGQAYIALRMGVKLGFYASQVAYFQ
nr:hypothetical protein [Vicinamibacterales bacterium]